MNHVTPGAPRFNRVVAFEVAKERLLVFIAPEGQRRDISNTAAAVRRLLRALRRRGDGADALVVCEASGGYERAVLFEADALGFPCHRAHGARVRAFARYRGVAAKTDAIDARLIAEYALATPALRLWKKPDPAQEAVRALKSRRDELTDQILAETNRLEHARGAVRVSLLAHLDWLKAERARLDKDLAAAIAGTPALAERARIMSAMVGVASGTSAALLAYMPELGTLDKGQAARLAGLAPIARDSGNLQKPRHVEPGRAAMKRALYMAAAARRCSRLSAFAARLKAKGKPFKVVIVAVMRKLLVILNARLAELEPLQA